MAGGKMKKKNPRWQGESAGPSNTHYQGEISSRKSKGQHILTNPKMVDSIIQKSGIKPTDVILEIGLGLGNLTKKLLKAGKYVIAIELDPNMVLELQRTFQGSPFFNRLQVIQGNVLECDLPYFDICVANIPYQLSSPLTFKLLAHRPLFRCAVIIFQKEFAMRLVAQPGDNLYCRLSVNTQLLSHVTLLLNVGKNNYRPPTKFDSSVVKIEPRKPLQGVKFKEWDGLVRISFKRKNKTLGSVFRQKTVLSLLENNYKTLQENGSLCDADIALDVSALGDLCEDLHKIVDDEDLELDNEDHEFKDKIMNVLKEGEFEGQRASNLTQADFMYLLYLFNKFGIHFS